MKTALITGIAAEIKPGEGKRSLPYPHKTALITGIAGQDGSYLAELLLGMGYQVAGVVRPDQVGPLPERLAALAWALQSESGSPRLELVELDLAQTDRLLPLLERVQPDEIYHLAALSHVGGSWAAPVEYTWMNAVVTAALLEAARRVCPQVRFYQACSSELFGLPDRFPQNEETAFAPRNPYATAKVAAYWSVRNAREAYGLFAVSGILYNHESPRRDARYVTRKITQRVAQIAAGRQATLALGNLDSRRDWGFAGDYVKAMRLMLQQAAPEDYVIGTGKAHTVRQFCEAAFACAGLEYERYVQVDPALYRPLEPGLLVADISKARYHLGWAPEMSFSDLVAQMVAADLDQLAAGEG